MCRLIDSYPVNIMEWSTHYNYYKQGIFNLTGKQIGFEILIDKLRTRKTLLGPYVHPDLAFSSAAKHFVSRLIGNIRCQNQFIKKKDLIFINIERSNLCDIELISRLVELDSVLQSIEASLVIEITERNRCGQCKRISEGIEDLLKRGLSLAIDDYDIYESDFRDKEVLLGLYQFIKVRAPKTKSEITKLFKFLSINEVKQKVIIEMIEDPNQINVIRGKGHLIYGLQGYAFDRGSPLMI
ncbi:EAL domain-containing protein [Vibrio mediterranei]|uniref:hypothetical protein n=1 Tax=Vibrio mediterranei TaxID=689 RepID=UPI0038CEB0E9